MTYDDLPAIIPIFPLSEVLLLPGGVLPLNIFEEKYVRMIEDVLGTHRMIGIVQPDEKARDQGSKDALLKTGCVGRISQFSETEDNRYLIMLKGVIRFEIGEEVSNILPYRQAEVNWKPYQDDIVEDCDTIEIDRDYFLPLLFRYLDMHDIECDREIIKQSPCEVLLTTLPMICPFDAKEKQALLEAKTLDNRYETLTTIISLALNSYSDTASITPLRH